MEFGGIDPSKVGGELDVFIRAVAPYGVWALLGLAFIKHGMPHLGPIFEALGKWGTTAYQAKLLHRRLMEELRIQAKEQQERVDKSKKQNSKNKVGKGKRSK